MPWRRAVRILPLQSVASEIRFTQTIYAHDARDPPAPTTTLHSTASSCGSLARAHTTSLIALLGKDPGLAVLVRLHGELVLLLLAIEGRPRLLLLHRRDLASEPPVQTAASKKAAAKSGKYNHRPLPALKRAHVPEPDSSDEEAERLLALGREGK